MATKITISADVNKFIDSIDKAGGSIENFSKTGNRAIEEIGAAYSEMSEKQKRSFSASKKQFENNIEKLRSLEKQYESLRQKQKSGQNLSQAEFQSLKKIAKEYKNLKGAIAQTSKEMNQMTRGIKNSSDGLKEIQRTAQQAQSSINSLNKTLGGIGALVTVDFIKDIGRALVEMGVSTIGAAAQMRQYEIAFQTMLKSAVDGRNMLQDLQRFAANTPFDVPGVVEAAQQLMAFGFAADEVIEKLTTFGDTAAGLGKGTAGVQQIAYAMGQIRTSGTLKTQDVNQLTNAGISAWEILAEASGKTILEIKKMTENGMIDSLKAVEVLTAGMNERFGGMMEKTSKEVTGLWSNITESIGTANATIGAFLTESLNVKGVLSDISQVVSTMSNDLLASANAGKSFGEAIREAVPAPVIVAVGALAALLAGALVAGLAAAAVAAAGFVAATFPAIGMVLGVSAAVGAAATAIALYWDEVKAATVVAWNAISGIIVGSVNTVLAVFFKGLEQISFGASKLAKLLGKDTTEIDKFHDAVDGALNKSLKDAADGFGQLSLKANSYADALRNIRQEQSKMTGTSDDWDSVSDNFDPYEMLDDATSEKKPKLEIIKGNTDISTTGSAAGSTVDNTAADKQLAREVEKIKHDSEKMILAQHAKSIESRIAMDVSYIGKLSDLLNEYGAKEAATEKKIEKIKIAGQEKLLKAENEYQRQVLELHHKRAELEQAIGFAKSETEIQNLNKQIENLDLQLNNLILNHDNDVIRIKVETNIDSIRGELAQKVNELTENREFAHDGKVGEINQFGKNLFNGLQAGTLTSFNEKSNDLAGAMANDDAAGIMNIGRLIGMSDDEIIAKGETIQDLYNTVSAALVTATATEIDQNNQALEAVQEHADSVKNLEEYVKSYCMNIANNLGSAFTDWITGAKSAKEAVKDFAAGLIQSIIQMAAQFGALCAILAGFGVIPPGPAAVKMMFGYSNGHEYTPGSHGDKIMHKANGGYISGPGTGTSDSIPAMLSNGEYVLNARAVQAVGVGRLNMMNSIGKIPHYNTGGYVGGGSPAQGATNNVTLNVSTIDASGFASFLKRGGLNRIKQALIDDTRNFGEMDGVY